MSQQQIVLDAIKTLRSPNMKALRLRVKNADVHVSVLEARGLIITTNNGRNWSVK